LGDVEAELKQPTMTASFIRFELGVVLHFAQDLYSRLTWGIYVSRVQYMPSQQTVVGMSPKKCWAEVVAVV